MIEFIYNMLAWVGEEGIIWTVAVLLILFFLLGLLFDEYQEKVPAMMTSLGILGAFCGIFIALYLQDFSSGKIIDSITALLNGVKTAFVTCLLGYFSSIAFRIVGAPLSVLVRSLLSLSRAFQPVTSPARRELLGRQAPLIRAPSKGYVTSPELGELLGRLDAIQQAIAGEGDSSMVTQMQKMRDENRGGFKKLDGLSETIRVALIKIPEGGL